METSNRNHANRPSPFTDSDRAKMNRPLPSPRRAANQLVNFGILAVSLAAVILAVVP